MAPLRTSLEFCLKELTPIVAKTPRPVKYPNRQLATRPSRSDRTKRECTDCTESVSGRLPGWSGLFVHSIPGIHWSSQVSHHGVVFSRRSGLLATIVVSPPAKNQVQKSAPGPSPRPRIKKAATGGSILGSVYPRRPEPPAIAPGRGARNRSRRQRGGVLGEFDATLPSNRGNRWPWRAGPRTRDGLAGAFACRRGAAGPGPAAKERSGAPRRAPPKVPSGPNRPGPSDRGGNGRETGCAGGR